MKNLLYLPIGSNYPTKINSVIEIPKDSSAKYEYDIELGVLRLDRVLISSMRYPASYGFIPQTISDDGDPLDVLVYNSVPIQSLAMVEIKPIGALKTVDNGEYDYKILGIPVYNPNNYNELTDLDETFLNVCEDFFKHYKNNDKKKRNTVVVNGWVGKAEALEIIKEKHNVFLNAHPKEDKRVISG